MKLLISAVILFAIGYSVDVWTPFLNEEGLEFDASQFEGLELSSYSSSKGGNGGGGWTDDCESAGGLKSISMECGKYVGMLKLQCANNGWKAQRGNGWGNGHGPSTTIDGRGITRVQINAGAYVDKVLFFKGSSRIPVKSCGASNGGGRYTATAPAGMSLCALRGRSGWWMDKLAAGWCQYDRDCKQSAFKCGACNKGTGKSTCTRSVIVTRQKKGKACGSSSMTKNCDVHCEQGSLSCGGCDKGTGLKACQRPISVHPKNNGKKCEAPKKMACPVSCEQTSLSCGGCSTSTGTKSCSRKTNVPAKNGGTACKPTNETHKCPVNCVQSGWKYGSCDRKAGKKRGTRTVTCQPKNGGTACGASTTTADCERDCQVGPFGRAGRCRNYKSTKTRSVTVSSARGGKACPGLTESSCCEMNGHRCRQQSNCCGSRCCSRYGWCGGSRDKRYDAWCGSKMSFMNHVAGFAQETGDISVGFTGVFAAVIFLPSFVAYKFFSKQNQSAEYQSLL